MQERMIKKKKQNRASVKGKRGGGAKELKRHMEAEKEKDQRAILLLLLKDGRKVADAALAIR